jgi:ornithine cyclodeaminase/alanine dehydrogenase-like protein (mu-crystallin family)
MRELDPALFKHARLLVDQRAAAIAESGEIIEAISKGYLEPDDIDELGELTEDARRSDDEVTVFKSVGQAALDLFTAVELLRRARVQPLGHAGSLSSA